MAIPDEHPQRQLPGLGLAAYVVILGIICTSGLVGLSVAWYSLFVGGQGLSPLRVSYGGLVDPSMLTSLREAGLLGPSELPDAFHAEDGISGDACAIAGKRVLRISREAGAQTILFEDIVELTGGDLGVTVRSPTTTIACAFRTGEGGGSFRAMLEHRG